MKRNIWLDDMRKMPGGYHIHFVKASDCIDFITAFPKKLGHISFDHDLGDDNDGTGYDVALRLESLSYYGKLGSFTYEIHSANPVGRKNINSAMRSAERYWKEIIDG